MGDGGGHRIHLESVAKTHRKNTPKEPDVSAVPWVNWTDRDRPNRPVTGC